MDHGRLARGARRVRHVPGLLRQALAKGWHDRLLGLSAEAAFWQMLSLPSLFLALVATLGYVSRLFGPVTINRTETQIEDTLGHAFSTEVVRSVIAPILHEVLHGDRVGVISVGFVLALWAGSSATATYVNTITIAYGQRDLRGAVRSRLLALWLFLGAVVFGVLLLPMLVLGPNLLADAFPEADRDRVSGLLEAAYYPVLVLLVVIGLTTLYRLAPPRRLPWHRGLPGAVLGLFVFLGGSTGLRAYIAFVMDRNHAYGTLAAPIAALLFFFMLAFGVLLGAEFNAAVEQAKPATVRRSRVLETLPLDPRQWEVFVPGLGRARDRVDGTEHVPGSAVADPSAERAELADVVEGSAAVGGSARSARSADEVRERRGVGPGRPRGNAARSARDTAARPARDTAARPARDTAARPARDTAARPARDTAGPGPDLRDEPVERAS